MTEVQMILCGLMLLVVAFVLRRSFSKSKASRRRDPQREARAEIHKAEASYAAVINKMELRLHDYARDIEGRIETKLAVLDRLLMEADQKIDQLNALAKSPDTLIQPQPALTEASRLDSQDELLKIYRLADKGLSLDEISELTQQPASHVRLILKTRRDSLGRDAA